MVACDSRRVSIVAQDQGLCAVSEPLLLAALSEPGRVNDLRLAGGPGYVDVGFQHLPVMEEMVREVQVAGTIQ